MRGEEPAGEELRIVFAAGTSRSGSTLLDLLLGAQPGVISTGEFRHLWNRGLHQSEPCGCGAPLPTCPFWTQVLRTGPGPIDGQRLDRLVRDQAALDSPVRFVVDALRGRMRSRPSDRQYEETLLSVYRAIRRVSGCSVIVDSSKHAPHGAVLARMARRVPGLRLTMVHMVRDSRGVAYSWYKIKTKRSGKGGLPRNLVRAAIFSRGWVSANFQAELLTRFMPRTVRLRYEDLCRDPRLWLSRILTAAGGGEVTPESLTLRSNPSRHHTVSGNPMRLGGGDIEVREDAAWRERLPASVRVGVTLFTAPGLWRYRRYGLKEG